MRHLLLLTAFFVVAVVGQGDEGLSQSVSLSCGSRDNCADCIRASGCSWCSRGVIPGSRKEELGRCLSRNGESPESDLYQCKEGFLHTPNSTLVVVNNGPQQGNMKPTEMRVSLRVGEFVDIPLDYTDPKDYPLDLYFLMDLSRTMLDDKAAVSRLGDTLFQQLRNLTRKYRQGFGSFIDKVAMPFVRWTWLDNPCRWGEPGLNCTTPWSFKHHLDLTDNYTRFSEEVAKSQLSAGTDPPEGGFDGLMQAMVCGRRIGWNEYSARKVILFVSDAPFHIAGDGKLGGIIRPHDGKCHLNSDGHYTHSTEFDYPSIAQLNHRSIENKISVIFAVTKENLDVYTQLASTFDDHSATSALLSDDSSNIVELVVKEYMNITSTIRMSDDFSKRYIRVKYFSSCLTPGEVEKETDACTDVPVGSSVRFTARVELLQCPTNKEEWSQVHKIYRVGLPDSSTVNLNLLCDCPCENEENWIPASPNCGGVGMEKCGRCDCIEPYFGKSCQCNAEDGVATADELKACTKDNDTQPCSGRGSCICGECVCETRANPTEKFSGRHCECDNFSCPRVGGELCGVGGVCECGSCRCLSGYTGAVCDCETDEGLCVQPGRDELCNGHGECRCGKCICEGRYSGAFCQKCLHESCPTRCPELSSCVQCKVFGTGDYAGNCTSKCDGYPITPVDVLNPDTEDESEDENRRILCKGEDETDDCNFHFLYTEKVDKSLSIDAQKTKECPPIPPIFWIIGTIIALVVLAGLILIAVWKLCIVVADRREYAKFLEESKRRGFAHTENPLYQNPTGRGDTPAYGKKAN